MPTLGMPRSSYTHAILAVCLAGVFCAPAAHGQTVAPLPFSAGERLVYDADASRLHGRAELTVTGGDSLGLPGVLVLRSIVNVHLAFVSGGSESVSWLDTARMATRHFERYERRMLARDRETISVDERGHWRAADGRVGDSPTRAPLDELSFIYALRAMPVGPEGTRVLNRHYDAGRNPTVVRFGGASVLESAAGRFDVRLVEMRVRDVSHYEGEGVIQLWLSDDPCRIPVRIRSDIPGAGVVTLTLASASPSRADCAVHASADR